jgi:CubicO group peptidase (beta-lactamase class C family)
MSMYRTALAVLLALMIFVYILGYVPTLAVAVPAAAEKAQHKPPAPQPSASAKAPSASDTGTHELSRADLEAFLDGFVPYALKTADIAGLTLVVVKDGQILFEKGYGYADVRTKRAMDPGLTLVRPGSTSKLFTWTAVMQLVEQGKLDLDRDVNDYLDFKVNSSFSKPITLRNLMTHRAGFEEGLKSVLAYDPKQSMTTEVYLKNHQRPTLFPPGEVPAYSNYGCALAGYIVQRVSGEPFESYVERHIYAPLGMTRSTFRQPVPEQLKADLSQGYITASEPPRPYEFIITAPAGSMSTTADDMAKFMIAYLQEGRYQENRILKPETVRQMFEPAVHQIDDIDVMALGFFEENRNGHRVRGHGGDTIVFHTDLDLFVDDGVGIFFSLNSRGENDSVYRVRQGLFDAFADRYFPSSGQPSAVPGGSVVPNAKEHAQLIAGRYQSSRRVESAFISVLYLLGQTVISANDDGTINVPTFASNKPKLYRETSPFVWTEEGGQRKVALVGEGSSRAVYSSDDPSSILQPVPAWESAVWNVSLLCASSAILLIVVILWPVSALLRWKYRQPSTLAGKELLVTRVLRVAALIDVVYLLAWIVPISPILSNHIEAYSNSLDPYIRLLQIGGLLVIAAAAAGIWAACQKSHRWTAAVWHVLNAGALVGIVWIAVITKLISFNLNY